jgi:group I intron endonuclease
MGHIYKHTSPSGKAYIGQSMQKPEARWKQHVQDAMRGNDLIFGQAIRKYGPDAFTSEILHEGIDDPDELDRLEVQAIAAHGTLIPEGYNMTTGGNCYRLEPEVRKRVSEGQKRVWSDPEYREWRSEQMKAVWEDPEYRERHAAAQAEFMDDLEYRAKLSAGMKAVWENRSPEQRAAHAAAVKAGQPDNYGELMRDLNKVRLKDPEVYEQTAARNRAQAKDPKWRRKVAEGCRRAFGTPEERARRSASNRKRWSDPKNRAKQSAAVSAAKSALVPSIFADGKIYQSMRRAARALQLHDSSIRSRIDSDKFGWWFKLPLHRDPECDAVEECWALMQFAKACPDHENVPDWLRPEQPAHGTVPDGFWS